MLNAGLSWSSDSYYTQTVDVGKRFGKDNAWGVRINALNATGGARRRWHQRLQERYRCEHRPSR